MNREAVYETWRGKDHPWVAWVKAPLFERAGDDAPAATDGPAYRAEAPPWAALDTSWLPERAAVIVDLPGEAAVFTALALGQRGLRPVFAVNACSAEGDLIPMDPVIGALTSGARFNAAFPAGPGVVPVFILDARRDGAGRTPIPGCFDNRWAVFESDLPSAFDLQRAGVTRVVLIQEGPEPLGDIEAVLRAYRAGGLELLLRDANGSGGVTPLTLAPRGWLAGVVDGIRRRVSARRRWDGSFGRRVPVPPAPSHG